MTPQPFRESIDPIRLPVSFITVHSTIMSRSADNLSLSERISAVVAAIPPGRVATYGQVAAAAGNSRAARQVVRILNAWSEKRGLPWFRVVNREGRISLPKGGGYEAQRSLLEAEGVVFGADERIELARFRWTGPAGLPSGDRPE